MSFLPLVERELRVAGRRVATRWIRVACVLAALLWLFPALLAEAMGGGDHRLGTVVFAWLSWLTFLLCLLAGPLLASDCLSRERREGTLGFLFLTNLKSHDVVLGKFCAVSLNAFYGLLAIFPILGLALLGGGVTFAEFWRMCAALLNALFFSVTLSMLVSGRARAKTAPTAATMAWVAGVCIAGAAALQASPGNPWMARVCADLSCPGPVAAFLLAPASDYVSHEADFWRSLLVSNGAGWFFLVVSAWGLRRSMRWESPGGGTAARKRRRRMLLEINPIVWLLDDSSMIQKLARLIALAGVFVAGLETIGRQRVDFLMGWFWPLCLGMKILFAMQSCRFFAENRQAGGLELLAGTSLTGREVIRGQWMALRRIFLAPFCVLAGASLVSRLASPDWVQAIFSGVGVAWQAATAVLDFIAIGWFGIWMGLTLRWPKWAAPLTILVAALIPASLLCVPNFLIDVPLLAIAQSAVSRWQNPRSRPWEMEPGKHWPAVGE